MAFTLPALPTPLTPRTAYIDARTMEIHHGKTPQRLRYKPERCVGG